MSGAEHLGGLIVGARASVTALSSKYSFDCYLSPAGNDSADGSIGSPWLTLARVQAEFDKYPQGALSMVRLYASAGTYTACNFDGTAFARGGRFVIQALSTTTLLSGTVIAGSTVSVMNTSALGGTNNYQRKWVRRRNQAGTMLEERLIAQNTTTSITPAVSWLSAPATTDTFEIYEPAVIFDGTAAAWALSNFRGMAGYQNRYLISGADPMGQGGGVYLADIRLLPNSVIGAYLFDVFLYTKSFELYAPALGTVYVKMSALSGWACGINAPGGSLTATQFMSTFMAVANDDMWFGCGVGVVVDSTGGWRVEGGQWWGYMACNAVTFNASAGDTPYPTALLCGGSIDAPVSTSNAIAVGYGMVMTRYPQLSPYNPMQISCAGNYPTVVSASGSYGAGSLLSLGYANILNTLGGGGIVCVRADAGGTVVLGSTCTGSSSNGFGIEARNGGVIQLSGALNITGAAGDSRVDGANAQAKTFYSAANVANPATPQGSGSRIYRTS